MQNTIVDLKLNNDASPSLTDKRTGTVWSCAGGPVVRCWNVAEERLRELTAGQLSIEQTGEDAAFAISAMDEGISFSIEYSLKDSMLEIRIPFDSIRENNPAFRLLSITPLPGFGAVRTGETGYMLLPNYSGVICRFDKDVSLTNGDIIYMHQSQWEHFTDLPVFGVCHGDSAFLGIVASGEFDTEIVTELNHGTERLNSIFPKLHLRYRKADEIDNVDRTVRYHFLAGSDADYAGMARAYRSHLLSERHLRPLKNRVAEEPALSDYDSYGFIKIFCASKSPQPDGQGPMHITATFAETQEILQVLKNAGIERATIILVGWNQEGHDGMYPTRLPAEPRLGGDDGLKLLIEFAKGLGYRITFHDNYADGYCISPDFSRDDVMKDSDDWPVCGGTWGGGASYIMCPQQMLQIAQRDLPRTKSLGLNGRCYLDAVVQPPRICYSKHHGHPATRRAYGEGVKAILATARQVFGACEVENAVDFVSDTIDGIAQVITHKLPVIQNTEFGRYFVDDFVPFYQIAYHGILQYRLSCPLNYKEIYGSMETGLLKEIEFGAMPRTELCYRQPNDFGFPSCKDKMQIAFMKKQYDILCKELGHLQLEFIDDHRMLAPGACRTLYSDGTEVIVNYGEDDFAYNGHTVKAKSYLVTEGREK